MPWKFISPFRQAIPAAASSGAIGAAPTAAKQHEPSAPPDEVVFIARQPIFDAHETVLGFELLFRKSGLVPEMAPNSIGDAASLLVNTLNRFGVSQALGDKTGFLQLGDSALDSDLVELLPKDRVVLEYPSDYLKGAVQEARCASLKNQGFQLARVCRPGETDLTNLKHTAGMIIYDLASQTLQDIIRLDRAVKPQNVQRLVRNVNSRSDFEGCKAFGFELYQGNFFAHAETLSMNRLDPARARIMEIFNLVINRADVDEIEAAFKHDVALCYSLLCYINSVGIGLQYKTSSIRDAVMLLGYDFLWRWLSLLIFAGVDLTAAQRVLLNTAIIRGRLTELLGQMKLSNNDGNALFLVGIFSLLDVLLGIPLEEVAQKLNLPDEVSAALRAREGRYATYLELALAFETNNFSRAERLCRELEIDLSAASQAHVAAIEWAGILAK